MSRVNRDLQKYIAEYKRRYIRRDNNHCEGGFFTNDYFQIYNISGGPYANIYTVIDNSFMAAFMIGYKKGQRDARKRNKTVTVNKSTSALF